MIAPAISEQATILELHQYRAYPIWLKLKPNRQPYMGPSAQAVLSMTRYRATMSKQYDNVLDLMRQPYSVKAALAKNSAAGEFDLYVNVIMNNQAGDDIHVIVPAAEWVASVCPQAQLAFGAPGGAACIHDGNKALSVPLF